MVWEHAAITLFAFEEEARGGRGRNQIRYLTVLPYVRLHLSSIQSRSDPTMVPLLICMWGKEAKISTLLKIHVNTFCVRFVKFTS